MQIHGLGHIHGPQQVNSPHRPASTPAPSGPRGSNTVDQLDISPEADLVSRVRDVPDIRQDKVDSIRAQIAAGTYETEQKLEEALSRLLDEIG